jgi:ribulose bisphosphate carboxylase small subunit
MYDHCIIQIQQLTNTGFPLGNWQAISHMSNATDMMIMQEMNQVRNRFNGRIRVRATDNKGRMIDMLPA